jgi:hypothetical protein
MLRLCSRARSPSVWFRLDDPARSSCSSRPLFGARKGARGPGACHTRREVCDRVGPSRLGRRAGQSFPGGCRGCRRDPGPGVRASRDPAVGSRAGANGVATDDPPTVSDMLDRRQPTGRRSGAGRLPGPSSCTAWYRSACSSPAGEWGWWSTEWMWTEWMWTEWSAPARLRRPSWPTSLRSPS